MSANLHSTTRDLTARVGVAGGGMDCRPMWMCQHKHSKGVKRPMGRGLSPLMWRCIDCARAKAQESAA